MKLHPFPWADIPFFGGAVTMDGPISLDGGSSELGGVSSGGQASGELIKFKPSGNRQCADESFWLAHGASTVDWIGGWTCGGTLS